MANLFDVFTVSFGKAKDARIAELEEAEAHRTRQRDEEITRNTGLGEQIADLEAINEKQGHHINELQAELAPFREYVAANPAETEAQADGAASPPAQVAKPKK